VPRHLPIVIIRLRTLLLQYCYSGRSRWVFDAKHPTSHLVFTTATHTHAASSRPFHHDSAAPTSASVGRLPRLLLHYPTLRYYYHYYRGDTPRLVVGAKRECRAHAIALAPFSAVASLRRADKRPSVKEPRVGPATQKP
jgi:hypothetical protein